MGRTVLFVDDDSNLLEGISRLLTVERSDILFSTATSAEEALKILGEKQFDVIVSDQKMGGISGLTLLSIAREKYPAMKRIMLSAQVHEDVYHEAESLAHKYIPKPCEFETIIAEIDRLFI